MQNLTFHHSMIVICQYCGDPAKLVNGDKIYPHRLDLYHLKFYKCNVCNAYVGTNNGKPLGTLANATLRKLRSRVHELFDPYWKSGLVTRTEAYCRLAERLNIPLEKCHIAMFDENTCNKIIDIILTHKKEK